MSESLAAAQRRSGWGTCTCGHPIYDHGRRAVPNAGIKEYTGCRGDGGNCACRLYRASDGSDWPMGPPAPVRV